MKPVQTYLWTESHFFPLPYNCVSAICLPHGIILEIVYFHCNCTLTLACEIYKNYIVRIVFSRGSW